MRFILDWISCIFLSTVIFISRIILLFRIYYIPNKEHKQFSLLLIIFIRSIRILIIRNNLIFILLGWDGLGISSYALVIYYQNYSSAASGTITILRNRLGDIIILISIRILIKNSNWNFNINEEFILLPIILLIIARCSKRAQFPFSAWLPAAIAAPTPISALVHSRTLVTAGVFLLIRIINIFHPNSILIIISISRITTIYAGIAANWEQDIKKIIALSTLRQIAIIIFAISIKSSILAFFHLITHALFKSTIFLCAGIIIHSSKYQDIRSIGLNINNNPLINNILGISTITLIGIPFISGFFSKDSILELIISSKYKCIITFIIIFSIGLTASYSSRLCIKSNKFLLKSNSNSLIHYNLFSIIPISILAPTSIFSGTLIIWLLNPEQLFLLPLSLKNIIIITIIIGLLLGIYLSFNKNIFIKIGQSAISLWFNHFITSSITKYSSPIIKLLINNDKSWQELYGPYISFKFSKNKSFLPDLLKISILFTLIILIITPIILII